MSVDMKICGNPAIRFMRALLCAALVAGALHGAGPAVAQGFPARPVKIIVANAPGGPVDSVARVLAPLLGAAWGQQVVVENRIGAGGNIGTEAAARAEPDGHTLLLTPSAPIVINPWLVGKLPYDPIRDFAPVLMVYTVPIVITVPGSLPVNSLAELTAYVKARPGKLNFSSGGIGTGPHLGGELYKQSAGLDIVHVPYRGGPEMTSAVVSGEVAFGFNGLIVMPLVRAGKLKVLGLAAPRRTSLAPDLPTFDESGIPGVHVNSWGGLFAPAKTSPEIISKLQADTVRALSEPGVRAKLEGIGVEPVGSSTEEFGSLVRAEHAKWAQVIRNAGIRVQQ